MIKKLDCLHVRIVPLVLSLALVIAGTCPVLAEGLPKMPGGEAAAGRIEIEAIDETVVGETGAAEESGSVEDEGIIETSGAVEDEDIIETSGSADEEDVVETSGAADDADIIETSGSADDEDVVETSSAADDEDIVETSSPAEDEDVDGEPEDDEHKTGISGDCGVLDDAAEFSGNCTYSISDGVLTISGNGDMGDMNHKQPWREQKADIKEIRFEEDVEYIGFAAFRSFPALEKLVIPESIKKIGNHAFEGCINLKEVDIYAEQIGEATFINCPNLETVRIHPQVKAIGVSAFEGCKSITAVKIEDIAAWCSIYFGGNQSNPLEQNRKEIGIPNDNPNHFYLNDEEIVNLKIPEGIKEIGPFTFYCAEFIRTVDIPDSVEAIGTYAFYRCQQLEKVTGASNVTYIGTRAFDGDVNLESLPSFDKINYVGALAFRYVPIASLSMDSGTIGKGAFYGCSTLKKENVRLGSNVKIYAEAFNTRRGEPEIIPSNWTDDRQTVSIGRWDNQDIDWVVLEADDGNGNALLISKNILKFVKYLNNEGKSPTYLKKTWKDSDLRIWLNGTFYEEAFSTEEKESIVSSNIQDDDNPVFGTKGGDASENKLYILSATELDKYFEGSDDRMAKRIPTAIAYRPGTDKIDSGMEDEDLDASYYWARTPGMYDYMQAYVHYSGNILYDGQDKGNMLVGIRPVMRVDASTYNIVNVEAIEREREEKIKGFVTRLYRLCLDREPDRSGFSAWVDALMSGKASASKVVRNFFYSQEMENLNLSDSEFLDRCYLVMMDRESDSSGKDSWMEVLSNGVTKLYVIRGFVNSKEFAGICDSYGVTKGELTLTDIRDRSYGITSYVARCYTKALGRKYDAKGLRNWISSIFGASDMWERAKGVAKDFLNSAEFKNKNLDNTEFCKVLYRVYLDREADKYGLVGWVAALEIGIDRNKVIDGFANSEEFSKLLERYLGVRKVG